MSYWNPTGDLRMEVSAFLIGSDKENQRALSSRTVALRIDGQERTFEFTPDERMKWDDSLRCRRLQVAKSDATTTFSAGLFAQLAVLIQPRDRTVSSTVARKADNHVLIRGMNGWLSTGDLKRDQAAEFFNPGRLGLISFQGNAKRFLLNEQAEEVTKDEQIVLHHAELDARVDEAGDLRVSGNADAIYRDGMRMNRTRWERLDWPARLAIFGGVPSGLLWLGSGLLSLLRRNPRRGIFSAIERVSG